MILDASIPFPRVARAVTAEFKGFPVEGLILKEEMSAENDIMVEDWRNLLDASPPASNAKVPVASN